MTRPITAPVIPGFHAQTASASMIHSPVAEGASDPLPVTPAPGSSLGASLPRVIAVTGSSGLVGSALVKALTERGHQVVRLVRSDPRSAGDRRWDPASPAADLLAGVDAVVHLAGASIAGRFTHGHKRAVRESRVGPTSHLADLAAATEPRPSVFVSASAIGYYGPERGAEILTEDSQPGSGFLAETVVDWEAAARRAEVDGIRVVIMRTGVAQSTQGGPLRLYRPLFALGLGARFGDGAQRLSWIDLSDLVAVYLRALADDRLAGPVNAVAPQVVTNAEYAATLALVMGRRARLAVPTLLTRLALGSEGARELVEADQHVVPAKLEALGHLFLYGDLESSLRRQLGLSVPSTADRTQ